jgi:hypothetical protein
MIEKTLFYTNHAIKQMFQRNITTSEIEEVLNNGETIIDYPNDKPLPSKLLFYMINERPLHVVCSFNNDALTTIIITAYIPSLDIWENDFKTRK